MIDWMIVLLNSWRVQNQTRFLASRAFQGFLVYAYFKNSKSESESLALCVAHQHQFTHRIEFSEFKVHDLTMILKEKRDFSRKTSSLERSSMRSISAAEESCFFAAYSPKISSLRCFLTANTVDNNWQGPLRTTCLSISDWQLSLRSTSSVSAKTDLKLSARSAC